MSKLTPRNKPPQKDLIAHWFDKYHFDIENGVVLSPIGDNSRLPQSGRCYLSNNVDSHVVFPEVMEDTKIRVELWFNPSSAKGMLLGDNTTAINSYIRIIDANTIRVKGDGTGFEDFTFTTAITLNEWHHLIFEKEGSSGFMSIDGNTQNNNTISIPGTLYFDQISRYYNGAQGAIFVYEGKITDIRIYNNVNLDLQYWFKCEDNGLIAFDSSGNGNHGTKVNTDTLGANTFHYEGSDVPTSYQNEVGYSDGDGTDNNGYFIPRDEANPTLDVLGNPLDYKGQVSYPAKLVESNCISFDGVDDKLSFVDLIGITITSYQGTSTLSINGNDIEGTAGTAYDILLSDGTHLPCAEGNGTTVFDASGNGNHGILINGVSWTKQDIYHYNFEKGFYENVPKFPFSNNRVFYSNSGRFDRIRGDKDFKITAVVQSDLIVDELSEINQIFQATTGSTRRMVLSITSAGINGKIVRYYDLFTDKGLEYTIGDTFQDVEIIIQGDGLGNISGIVDGNAMVDNNGAAAGGMQNFRVFSIGGVINAEGDNIIQGFEGFIKSLKVETESIVDLDLTYNNGTFIDAIGSYPLTEFLEPNILSPIADEIQASFEPIIKKPSQRNHNGAETKIDFNPYNAPKLDGLGVKKLQEETTSNFYQSLTKKGESLFYVENDVPKTNKILNYNKHNNNVVASPAIWYDFDDLDTMVLTGLNQLEEINSKGTIPDMTLFGVNGFIVNVNGRNVFESTTGEGYRALNSNKNNYKFLHQPDRVDRTIFYVFKSNIADDTIGTFLRTSKITTVDTGFNISDESRGSRDKTVRVFIAKGILGSPLVDVTSPNNILSNTDFKLYQDSAISSQYKIEVNSQVLYNQLLSINSSLSVSSRFFLLGVVGQLAECIIYDRALSSEEMLEVNNYLKSKWSLNKK